MLWLSCTFAVVMLCLQRCVVFRHHPVLCAAFPVVSVPLPHRTLQETTTTRQQPAGRLIPPSPSRRFETISSSLLLPMRVTRSTTTRATITTTTTTSATVQFATNQQDDSNDTASSSSSSCSSAHDETNQQRQSSSSTISVLTPRERRRKLIGLAKAVNRGQYMMTSYQPGGLDKRSFQALSGLPADRTKPFIVLGIESSCDDTGAAVIRSDGYILGEALASQSSIHEPWGGVVPGLARDAHVEHMDAVVQLALTRAGLMSAAQVDAIGVTVGPGLEICLRVGLNKARDLALQYEKPFVGVHHLEAHILMARMPLLDKNDTNMAKDDEMVTHHGTESTPPYSKMEATRDTHASARVMDFPFLALLVSGGHCQLLKCMGIGDYTILGGTMDDSLGEAFDKTARLLGLPVGGGGGPAVERLAMDGDATAIPFSVPLRSRKDCDFSYSGLKTNVRRYGEQLALDRGVSSIADLPYQDRANIAASFQHVAIQHVEQRLRLAMSMVETDGIDTLAVVGGVAANQEIRRRIDKLCRSRVPSAWKLVVPPPRLCTDQGSMSAWAAIERLMVGSSDDLSTQQVYARYPLACQDVMQL